MAIFFTDFSTVTNGPLADSADWSTGSMGANWSATVQTDAGATGGKSVLLDDNDAWGDEWASVLCDNTPSGGTTGNVEVLARVKFGTLANLANNTLFGPALFATAATDDCYGLQRVGTNSWQVAWHRGGSEWGTVGSAATITDPSNDTYFWIRLTRNSTTIKANMWTGAAGDEPAGFNISGGTDTNLTNLKAGIGGRDADVDYTFDIFSVSTDGDKTAPTTNSVEGTALPECGFFVVTNDLGGYYA